MQFQVILNRDGGTLRTLDLDTFSQAAKGEIQSAGHEALVSIVDGSDVDKALEEAVSSRCDVVMVGGGDGTVSSAAEKLNGSDKALAVLPAGTMNLFARSLGIPLQLDEAVRTLAHGEVRPVDLASANGKVFVHQFSIGLHAKLIKLREKREFASRLGKIRASTQAALDALLRPPRMRVTLAFGGKEMSVSTSGIGITNNLFGEGHLPYTDTPDGGVLGVYVTRARSRSDFLKFAANIAVGRWRANTQVDIYETEEIEIIVPKHHRRFGCAIDGELGHLRSRTVLRIHPGALRVLAPASLDR